MKRRQIIISCVVLAVLCIPFVVAYLAPDSEWQRIVKALQSLPRERVDAEIEAFARDQRTGSNAPPSAVELGLLIKGNYLRADEVGLLNNLNVIVSPSGDESLPSKVLVRVFLPNGRTIVELADGSIQMGPPR